MFEFRMPSLGADMEAGKLTRWLVKPGDQVERGQIVAVVETEKSDIDVEIWASGEVAEIVVPEGQKVPVGTLLATLRTAGEEAVVVAPALVAAAVAAAPAAAGVATVAAPAPSAMPAPPGALRVSPAARRRAAELGVDLQSVAGSGPEGAVQIADVERAASAPGTRGDRAAAMRHAITAAVERSHREIPHYYLSTEIVLDRALAWLEQENLQRPVTERMLPAALLLKAVALALREVPELNGFFKEGALQASAAIHLGVAISLRDGGLVAPALHDADRRSLTELMSALRDLVRRARAGSLRGSEVTDATITVTNLGDRGVDAVFGVIYPPQVALVGLGRIRERPWAENGTVVARPVVTASLAADHRASDGHRGGLFLEALARLLQEPERLAQVAGGAP